MTFNILQPFEVLGANPTGPVHHVVVGDHVTLQRVVGEKGLRAERTTYISKKFISSQ